MPLVSLSAIINTFKDFVRHGPTTIFTAGILALPVLFAAVFRATVPGRGGTTTQLIFQVLSYITRLWMTVAIVMATLDYATGRDPGVGGLLTKSLDARRIWSYFLASLLFGVVIAAIIVAAFIPFIGSVISSFAGAQWDFSRLDLGRIGPLAFVTLALSSIAAIALTLVVFLRIGAYHPASILEKRGPVDSLRRSSEVTRGHRLDFLLLWIFLSLIGGAAFIALSGPTLILTFRRPPVPTGFNPFDPFAGMDSAQILVNGASSFLFQTLWAPFVAAAVTNFFLELRGRSSFDGMNRGEPLPGGESQPDSEKQEQATGQDRKSRNLVE